MMIAVGNEPVFEALPSVSDMEPTLGEAVSAIGGTAIRNSFISSAYRWAEMTSANAEYDPTYYSYGVPWQHGESRRTVTAEAAAQQAKDAGAKVDFGTANYTPEAVALMIDRAHRQELRDTLVSRYKPSMGLHLGVSLLASLADPVNVGAAFIPFVGQARYGALLAKATGFGGRTATRVGVGVIEGAAGATLLEPIVAAAHLSEGQDYGLAQSVKNIAFGGVLGAGLHASVGGVLEKVLKRQYGERPVTSPADITERLPLEINEAALRAAISDMVHGRPVAASDVIDMFMTMDPAAARSISYAQTLRGSGPSIDDTLSRIQWWFERLGEKPFKPQADDFVTWLRARGGLRDVDGVLEDALGAKPDMSSALYIGKRGARRTTRGVDFETLLKDAIDETFVTSRQQLIDALKASQRSQPLRPVYRSSDEKLIALDDQFREHTQVLLRESGVAPEKNRIVRARAIVGREQHIVAAERARLASAIDKLVNRYKEYQAEGSVVQAPKPYEAPKVEAPKVETAAMEGEASQPAFQERTYTFKEVAKAIQTSLKVSAGEEDFKVPLDRIISDYLPGMSKTKLQPFLDRLKEERNLGVEKGKVFYRKMSKEEVAAKNAEQLDFRINEMRRRMNEDLPESAKTGRFYLSEIANRLYDARLKEGTASKAINAMVKDGKARVYDEATGKNLKLGPAVFEDMDRPSHTIVEFLEPAKPAPAVKPPLTATVQMPIKPTQALVKGVPTPAAERSALTVAELEKSAGEYAAILAQIQQRLETLRGQVPEETFLNINNQIRSLGDELSDLERVYNAATECLINPPKG